MTRRPNNRASRRANGHAVGVAKEVWTILDLDLQGLNAVEAEIAAFAEAMKAEVEKPVDGENPLSFLNHDELLILRAAEAAPLFADAVTISPKFPRGETDEAKAARKSIQLRVSSTHLADNRAMLYDENNWRAILRRLVDARREIYELKRERAMAAFASTQEPS